MLRAGADWRKLCDTPLLTSDPSRSTKPVTPEISDDICSKFVSTGLLQARKLGRKTVVLQEDLDRFLEALPAASVGIKQSSSVRLLWAGPRKPEPTKQKGSPATGRPFNIPFPSPAKAMGFT